MFFKLLGLQKSLDEGVAAGSGVGAGLKAACSLDLYAVVLVPNILLE